jgi:hypothetical protein
MKRLLIVLPLLFAGCQRRVETETRAFVPRRPNREIAILIDMSGSFSELMTADGKAYAFAQKIIDTYFKNHMGSEDRLLIAQISESEPLVWEGTPLDLRRDFASASSFGEFLKSKSTDGSPIHAAMASTLEYLMSITDPSTKTAFFVLSDMDDTDPKTPEMRTRLHGDLSKFGQRGGVVGLYYVTTNYEAWKRELENAGIKEFVVESQIVSHPDLPNLED